MKQNASLCDSFLCAARSIGPALFVGGWAIQQLWLFIVAPLIGAAIAAGISAVIRIPDETIGTRQAERALGSQQEERGKDKG